MAEKGLNLKTEWINTLLDVQDSLVEVHNDKRVTFFTTIGMVIGERCELKNYDFSVEGKFAEELENDPQVNPYAIVESLYQHRVKDVEDDVKLEDKDKRIFLKNVTIYRENTPKLTMDNFMLFSDHVIGVLPKAIEL